MLAEQLLVDGCGVPGRSRYPFPPTPSGQKREAAKGPASIATVPASREDRTARAADLGSCGHRCACGTAPTRDSTGIGHGRDGEIWLMPLRNAWEAAERLRVFWGRNSPHAVDGFTAMILSAR